jgi:hypothetical protein
MSENLIPGEDNELERLVLRLLVFPRDPRVNNPRLFLGQIPENLPVEVPLPEQSHVLGTLARSEEQVEIVLTSDLQPDEILRFYRERLTPLGWNELEESDLHHRGGFLHRNVDPSNHVTFCQSAQSAALTLNIMQMEGTTTDVRLTLNLDDESNPCSPQQTRRHRHMRHPGFYEVIPTLSPPAGARQQGGGGSSGTDEASTSAKLKTHLTIDVLLKHYTNQLSQAGWTQTAEGVSGPLAWNTWKFTYEEQESWHGLFFILKTPEKQEDYFLFIRAAWDHPESTSKRSGWFSSSSSF